MFATRRTLLLGAGAAALLASCGGGDVKAADAADMSVGASGDDAPHLIEYASVTCPHCADFHARVWPTLKEEFIDTGKVKFTFREWPTDPAPAAVAGFQVARCGSASADDYFARLGAIFTQQRTLFGTTSMARVEANLIRFGAESGLSEAQVRACIRDDAGADRINRVIEDAGSSVTGTPTFFLNGREVDRGQMMTVEGMRRVLNEAIGGS